MARSRSPRVTRFSKAVPPTLKSWVLCRVGTSKWRDAVPALVSRVGDAESGSQKGGSSVLVNVLAPNVLALQHSFGGGAYKELRGLNVQEVRPYHGHELQNLRDALMAAFRQQARARAASVGPPVEDDENDVEEEGPPSEVPPLNVTPEAGIADAPPVVSIARELAPGLAQQKSKHTSTQVEEAPTPCVAMDTTQAAKPSQDAAPYPSSTAQVAVAVPQASATPEPAMPRSIGAPITPECPLPSPPAGDEAAGREDKAKVSTSLTKQRLRTLTAVVAKAFHSARETTLTRGELQAMACASEAKVSAAELDEALDRLSASGKVFLSSDLVFLL